MRTPGPISPGGGDSPRPGEHRLPAADFMIQVVVWIVFLLAGLLAASVMVGALYDVGLMPVDRDAVWELTPWVVPAAGVMALLRTLGLAPLVDWLGLLHILMPLGVVLIAVVPLAIVTTVVLLLRMLGVDTGPAEPVLVLASHTIGGICAVSIWLTARPPRLRGGPADEPRDSAPAPTPAD